MVMILAYLSNYLSELLTMIQIHLDVVYFDSNHTIHIQYTVSICITLLTDCLAKNYCPLPNEAIRTLGPSVQLVCPSKWRFHSSY